MPYPIPPRWLSVPEDDVLLLARRLDANDAVGAATMGGDGLAPVVASFPIVFVAENKTQGNMTMCVSCC